MLDVATQKCNLLKHLPMRMIKTYVVGVSLLFLTTVAVCAQSEIKQDMKALGKDVKKSSKNVGKQVAKESKKIAKGTKKVAKATGKGAKKEATRLKKAVKKKED